MLTNEVDITNPTGTTFTGAIPSPDGLRDSNERVAARHLKIARLESAGAGLPKIRPPLAPVQ